MYLLIAVMNNEELLDELITGWLDMGITGATVAETTDVLQLISHNIFFFVWYTHFLNLIFNKKQQIKYMLYIVFGYLVLFSSSKTNNNRTKTTIKKKGIRFLDLAELDS